MRAERVEQLFLRRRGGRLEVLVVAETPAGERQRETLLAPTAEPEAAVRYAAVQLARRGLVAAPRLRLRRERGGALVDDAALRRAFLEAMAAAGGEGPWE